VLGPVVEMVEGWPSDSCCVGERPVLGPCLDLGDNPAEDNLVETCFGVVGSRRSVEVGR